MLPKSACRRRRYLIIAVPVALFFAALLVTAIWPQTPPWVPLLMVGLAGITYVSIKLAEASRRVESALRAHAVAREAAQQAAQVDAMFAILTRPEEQDESRSI